MNFIKSSSKPLAWICCALFVLGCVMVSLQADHHESKPEYTMEDIMQKGQKGDDSLLKKVLEGRATEKETKQLIDYYLAMEKYDPPKGDKESWVEKTSTLTKAAIFAFAKTEGSLEALKEASNCRACHTKHRPD